MGKNHNEQTFWRRATASRLHAMTATTNILCYMIKDVVEVDGSRFRGPPSWSSTLIEIKYEPGKKSRWANFLASRHGVTTPRHNGHDQYFMLYDQGCSGGGWVSFPRAPILVQHFDRNKKWSGGWWMRITRLFATPLLRAAVLDPPLSSAARPAALVRPVPRAISTSHCNTVSWWKLLSPSLVQHFDRNKKWSGGWWITRWKWWMGDEDYQIICYASTSSCSPRPPALICCLACSPCPSGSACHICLALQHSVLLKTLLSNYRGESCSTHSYPTNAIRLRQEIEDDFDVHWNGLLSIAKP